VLFDDLVESCFDSFYISSYPVSSTSFRTLVWRGGELNRRKGGKNAPSCLPSTTSFLNALTLVNAHSLCAILTLALLAKACCSACNFLAKSGSWSDWCFFLFVGRAVEEGPSSSAEESESGCAVRCLEVVEEEVPSEGKSASRV
jgi:hypothetical protein